MPEMQSNGRRQLPPPPGDPKPTYLEGDAGRLDNVEHFPFGTCPKWVEYLDDDSTLVINQSNAILRHIARRTDLFGTTPAESAQCDAWLDHLEDVRKAYNDCIYGVDEPPFRDDLSNADADAAAAIAKHAPSTLTAFAPFERRLATSPQLVGAALTCADVALADLFDVHLRLWPAELGPSSVPQLHKHLGMVHAQPAIAAYLQSGKRWSRVNGNALG